MSNCAARDNMTPSLRLQLLTARLAKAKMVSVNLSNAEELLRATHVTTVPAMTIHRDPETLHLELRPKGSRGISFKADPWSDFYDRQHRTVWSAPDANHGDVRFRPCRKLVVDWIMAFASPATKHVPKETLEDMCSSISLKHQGHKLLRWYWRTLSCCFYLL